MLRRPRHHALVVLAAAPLLLVALAGCGSDDDPSASDNETSSDDGFVTGTPEEWLHAVCGDDVTVSPTDDPAGLKARYGKDATGSYFCETTLDGGSTDTYPEAALFDTDPSQDWEPGTGKTYLTFGIGQVADDQWAVVYEDSSTAEIDDPHVAPLTDFGFEVYENNEPAG